jgi:hypothetical protein
LNTLLAYLTRLLQSLFNLSSARPRSPQLEAPAESPILLPPGVERHPAPRPAQPERLPLRQRLKQGLAHRLDWLRRHPILDSLILLGVVVIWLSEHNRFEWWGQQLQRFREGGMSGLWLSYRWRALILILLVSLFLTGPTWLQRLWQALRGLWRWSIGHVTLAIALLAALLALGSYLAVNANAWTFGVVEVGVAGLDANDIAIQFRGSLNAVGSPPFDKLPLSSPGAPKKVNEVRVSLEPLSLSDCPDILLGPDTFENEGQPISLRRPQSGDTPDSGGHTITLSTAVGSLDLPLEGFFRSMLRLSANYREFNIQVIPAGQADELNVSNADADPTAPVDTETIRIIVNDTKGGSWTVVGPRSDLPQLVNFLVIRMTLDLLAQPADPISNARLALTLGNQAFDSRDFDSALAYYRLAESFERKNPVIQAALGITYYQLSALAPAGDRELRLRQARRALERGQLQPASLPYLACLQAALNDEAAANISLRQFNETLSATSPEAVRERRAQLEPPKHPALGPGRALSLSVNQPEATAEPTFDLYYFAGNQLYYYLNQPTQNPALQPTQVQSATLAASPRQIFAVQQGLYYVTQDGLVNFFRPGQGESRIIKETDLIIARSGYTGGIRQIFVQPPISLPWAALARSCGIASTSRPILPSGISFLKPRPRPRPTRSSWTSTPSICSKMTARSGVFPTP